MPKAKKSEHQNAKLDAESKTPDQLHAAWVAAFEESAVTHMELKAARQALREALESWATGQEHTLTPDSRSKIDRRLLRCIRSEKRLREEARAARDSVDKAWEATGLPAARGGVPKDDADDLEEPVVA